VCRFFGGRRSGISEGAKRIGEFTSLILGATERLFGVDKDRDARMGLPCRVECISSFEWDGVARGQVQPLQGCKSFLTIIPRWSRQRQTRRDNRWAVRRFPFGEDPSELR
jgi:hypothetical protein